MTDKLLAILSLVPMAGFVFVIVGFVPDVDLAIVCALTVAMAGYDFYKSAFKKGG